MVILLARASDLSFSCVSLARVQRRYQGCCRNIQDFIGGKRAHQYKYVLSVEYS